MLFLSVGRSVGLCSFVCLWVWTVNAIWLQRLFYWLSFTFITMSPTKNARSHIHLYIEWLFVTVKVSVHLHHHHRSFFLQYVIRPYFSFETLKLWGAILCSFLVRKWIYNQFGWSTNSLKSIRSQNEDKDKQTAFESHINYGMTYIDTKTKNENENVHVNELHKSVYVPLNKFTYIDNIVNCINSFYVCMPHAASFVLFCCVVFLLFVFLPFFTLPLNFHSIGRQYKS